MFETQKTAHRSRRLVRIAWLAIALLLMSNTRMHAEEAAGANPHPLVGELLLSTNTESNVKSAVVSKSSTLVLQAVLTATSAGAATLARDVTLYDGGKAVGTAALLLNRTTARFTLTNLAAGTHTYTAVYPADGNYAAYSFGSVTVTVQANADVPALVRAYVVAANNASAMAPGATLQFTAHGDYSDGSTAPLPDVYGNKVTLWNTTNHGVAKISSLGHATALALGKVSIEAAVGTLAATPWLVTVRDSANTPTLISSYVLARDKAKTVAPGKTLQFTAYGKYSDGSTAPLPDVYGNKVTLWNTSDHGIAKVSELGHATALGTGTVNVEAVVGSLRATPYAVTVVAPEPLSVTCAVNPTVVDPGGSVLITSTATSAQGLPLTYRYQTSAGTVSETGTIAKLETPQSFVGPIQVTCTAEEEGGVSASNSTAALVSNSSGNLVSASNWKGEHDLGTPGSASGSTRYPVAMAGVSNTRNFSVDYAARGGERYSISFGHDALATHFVYDASVYIEDPTQIANLEMDMNQVTANGQTVIYGTQCSGYSKTWEYTTGTVTNGQSHPRWVSSNLACDPSTWEANTWHHVQIASSRNSSGVVSYDWVNLDGVNGTFKNAVGPSSFGLGWPAGDLLLNFQLDGASKANGTIVAYLEEMTIYRW